MELLLEYRTISQQESKENQVVTLFCSRDKAKAK
jgi:hypothetical protein